MKNKIRSRLLLYFAGSLLVFSLIIGIIFSILFSRHNTDVHKAELEDRAENIAEALAGFWIDSAEQGQGHGIMGQGMGYGAYLQFLDDIAMADVWIVDHNLDQITRGHGQVSLAYNELPPGAEAVIGWKDNLQREFRRVCWRSFYYSGCADYAFGWEDCRGYSSTRTD